MTEGHTGEVGGEPTGNSQSKLLRASIPTR